MLRYANMESIYATSPGNFCQRQAATSFENGLSCYRNMGMTQDCAKLWADASWNVSTTKLKIIWHHSLANLSLF